MKKIEPARAHGLAKRGATPKSVPRVTTPDAGALLDFLTDATEDPEDQARRLFPGPFARQRYLRSSYVEIAAALAYSGAADAWLTMARDATGALRELDHRPTLIEDALTAALEHFREAARTCRRARSSIHEARRLAPRRQRLRLIGQGA